MEVCEKHISKVSEPQKMALTQGLNKKILYITLRRQQGGSGVMILT